jgi:hypothetical protein
MSHVSHVAARAILFGLNLNPNREKRWSLTQGVFAFPNYQSHLISCIPQTVRTTSHLLDYDLFRLSISTSSHFIRTGFAMLQKNCYR